MRPFLNQMSKMEFLTFLAHFGALNATICTSELHISSTIKKYGISAFTGKKINVIRPKLISNDKNEIWENFNFFFKKLSFFEISRICKKNSSKSCFFWKFHPTSKHFRITSNHFENFLKLSLESSRFTLNDSGTPNATNSFPGQESHLEAKSSQF